MREARDTPVGSASYHAKILYLMFTGVNQYFTVQPYG